MFKTNFLNTNRKKSNKRWFYLLIFFIFGLIFLFILNFSAAQEVYRFSLLGKSNFLLAQKYLNEQDFSKATIILKETQTNFDLAQKSLSRLKFLKYLPGLNQQYQSLTKILTAGNQTASATQKVSELISSVIIGIKKGEEGVSLSSLNTEEKKFVLKKIYESPPELQGVKAEIELAFDTINQIPKKGLAKPLSEARDTFLEYLPQISNGLERAIPFTQVFPPIAGYPERKTYLFLLQNNSELRPTGGFIGTYGILKLENGEIINFTTDNSYNLDSKVKDTFFVDPPWELKKYLKTTQWFFRDSNWSPDFPESAKKSEWFYLEEGGEERNLDGVIAITPTFIQSLLDLTGEIEVDGIKFNSENVVEVLQYQVEKGFYRQGIPFSERKEIIGSLAGKVLEKIMSLPQNDWPNLWKVFDNNVTEKHILIYPEDQEAQKIMAGQNWTGEILKTEGDYLAIFDANLASLKTDAFIKRAIFYKLEINEQGELIAEVKIEYKSDANFDWKSTRYRTYTRFYVPLGSELVSYEGFMENDSLQSREVGQVEVKEEFGKTQFGGFISVEPKTTGNLIIRYKLPQSLKESLERGSYQLLVQKQPGTQAHDLKLDLNFDKEIKTFAPLDKGKLSGNNKIIFESDLREDRDFNLTF